MCKLAWRKGKRNGLNLPFFVGMLTLLVWMQIGPIFPSGTQVAQELKLFPGYAQDAWVGYRAQRQGQVHLYLHHVDSSGKTYLPGAAGIFPLRTP
jgi:hypothetical protein